MQDKLKKKRKITSLYEYVSKKYKNISFNVAEWIDADYAAILQGNRYEDIQPIKEKDIESILFDQISYLGDISDIYELYFEDMNGKLFRAKIKNIEWELEEC